MSQNPFNDDPLIKQVLDNSKSWSSGFNKPMKLGVKKKLVVLTCMDSRLIPEEILGLDVGDAEVIRNGGGRVTLDVLRSMVICQDLLQCDHVLIIHHTDCGGQALYRKHDEIFHTLHEHITHRASLPLKALWLGGWYASSIIPRSLRQALVHKVVHDIPDLPQSVVDDMKALRTAPNIRPDLKLYGFIYSTETGGLTPLAADVGGGKLLVTEEFNKMKEADGKTKGASGGSHSQQKGA